VKTVKNSSVQYDNDLQKICAYPRQMQLYLEFKLHSCKIAIDHLILKGDFPMKSGNDQKGTAG